MYQHLWKSYTYYSSGVASSSGFSGAISFNHFHLVVLIIWCELKQVSFED